MPRVEKRNPARVFGRSRELAGVALGSAEVQRLQVRRIGEPFTQRRRFLAGELQSQAGDGCLRLSYVLHARVDEHAEDYRKGRQTRGDAGGIGY